MSHKDLSEDDREHLEYTARLWAQELFAEGQSLAIAREAWINAFDRTAAELDAA